MDLQVLYPSRGIINSNIERVSPEFYNYMCVHGCQLFIRVSRKQYEVLTASWYPKFADKEKYNFMDRLHSIVLTRSFTEAMDVFKRCADELVLYINYGQLRM